MLLFQSEEHIARWCSANAVPRGGSMSLETMVEIANTWYGKTLEATWRRKTLVEAQAVFHSFGLTGEFWQLAP